MFDTIIIYSAFLIIFEEQFTWLFIAWFLASSILQVLCLTLVKEVEKDSKAQNEPVDVKHK